MATSTETSADEAASRAKEAVAVGYALGFDLNKLGIIIKFRIHDGRKFTYAIPALGISSLCNDIIGASVMHGWTFNPPNRAPTIKAGDWDAARSLIVPRYARPWAFQNTLVLEFVLDDRSVFHAMAPGHAIGMAEEILSEIQANGIHDVSAGAGPKGPLQ